MNTGEDESSSGLNGRLRPRKSAAPSPQNSKFLRKTENKPHDKPKRTSTPSKGSKNLDLTKSDFPNSPQFLCPYCDRKFASKQTVSKHVRRIHLSVPKQDSSIGCLYCTHTESDSNDIIRHMVDNHPNQYFACLDCHTRFPSTVELAEHKLNGCEKQKLPYRSKLRQKTSSGSKKNQKSPNVEEKGYSSELKEYSEAHRFNGVVISCELKPSQVSDEADIEDNITTNLILPPSKNLGTNAVMEKNAVIVLDDIQWNKRMPTNFSFHNTDADQILSRLGVVHRSPRTGESTKRDLTKSIDESTQKFEKCFDTSFYSKVASNVQENLTKFLDGSFNFNPDAEHTIKTRKSKNSVVINTAEGFPILLAYAQYTRNVFDGYMPRAIAPKHKWKWESDKNPMNPDDIRRDSHLNNCIITLVSSLDIWTQLCMRRKFEDEFGIAPLEKKTEKQNAISKELKEILESREIPSTSTQLVKSYNKPIPSSDRIDFPSSLGLIPTLPMYDLQPAVLSGEWVRPRCYVCCACGAQTRDSRGLSSHISTQHPNAQVQHYEIVGELLLNADILKHLYVPPSQMCNRTRPLRGFRECTKCKKSISLEDLHQHMLDCAGDTPAVRRKCRYRPFGVRRRRPRLPDNTIRKKIRKDMRRQTRQTRQKPHIRSRPKIRSEVGDAETIRKMIADLPAKRHRVLVNPSLRPRSKHDKQRSKLLMKRHSGEVSKNIKARENKDSNEVLGSVKDNKDDKSNNDKDDEDNKPLKPRIKRVLTQRQNESLKRKVAMNRAKRRAQLKEQKVSSNIQENNEPTEMLNSSKDKDNNQLSGDSSPQKVEVNSSGYNTREHSGRSRSSNSYKDEQKSGGSSGGSGQNGNMNNDHAGPSQNATLKHSIARLTSGTDPYENSLQYHHLYLVQQDSDDPNEHVPSGQQRLFENEAVVTKLDKPPLHFQQSGTTDPYAYHKSKLNKPRKGLNDCIQMLRNKLVEPLPSCQTSQSAAYAGAEYQHGEAFTANRRSSITDYHMDPNSKPAEVFSRHQLIQDRLLEIQNDNHAMAQNFADLSLQYLSGQKRPFELTSPSGKVEKVTKQSKQKSNIGQPKRESTRRRSTRSEKVQRQKKSDLPPHAELTTRRSVDGYTVTVSTPSKVNPVPTRRNSSHNIPTNLHSEMSNNRSSELYSQALGKPSLSEYHAETNLSFHRLIEMQHQPQFQTQFPPQFPPALAAQLVPQIQLPPPLPVHLQLQLQLQSHAQLPQPQRQSPQKSQLQSPPQTQLQTSPRAQRLTPPGPRLQPKHQTSSDNHYQVHQRQIPSESQTQQISINQTLSQPPVQPQRKMSPRSQTQSQRQSPSQSQIQTPPEHSAHIQFQSAPNPQSMIQSQTSPQPSHRAKINSQTDSPSPSLTQSQQSRQPQSSQIQLQSSKTQIKPLSQIQIQTQMQNVSAQPLSLQMQSPRSQSYTHRIDPETVPIDMKQTELFKPSQQSKQKHNFEYAESSYSTRRELDVSSKMGIKIYQDDDYNVPTGIPHTVQSNLEPALPVPLDLSVNVMESTDISTKENNPYVMIEYYETLDLSNKSSDRMRRDIAAEGIDNDEVVDLRIKSNSQSDSLELCENNDETDGATDLTIKTLEMENIPTDLSLKKKPKNVDFEYETRNESYECVQDLSSRKSTHTKEISRLVLDINPELPTDLSGKKVNDKRLTAEGNIAQGTTKDTSKQNVDNSPADLSAIRNSQNQRAVRKPANEEPSLLLPSMVDTCDEDTVEIRDVSIKDKTYNQDDFEIRQIRLQHIKKISEEKYENVPNQFKQQPSMTAKNQDDTASYRACESSLYIKTHENYRDKDIKSHIIKKSRETEFVNDTQSRKIDKTQESLTLTETKTVALVEPEITHDMTETSPPLVKSHDNFGERANSPHLTLQSDNYKPQINLASRVDSLAISKNVQANKEVILVPKIAPITKSCNRNDLTTTDNNSSSSVQAVPAVVTKSLCDSVSGEPTPMYTLSNSVLTLLSKHESTTPVYTLTDTCISMTKIESANVPSFTKACSSVAGSSATSSKPVYTLTDTATTLSSNHEASYNLTSNSIPLPPTEKNKDLITSNILTTHTTTSTISSLSETPRKPDQLVSEVDPETAKKIAMLPKELVEILGTMPVDHRNQLLKVLPHYVSKSPNMPMTNDSANDRTSVDFESPQYDEIKPFANLQNITESLPINPINLLDSNRIIDLTDDDIPTHTKTSPSEEYTTEKITDKESVLIPETKPIKQKNNDKTASLRAVRIKAPSERNKSLPIDNQLIRISCQDQNTNSLIFQNFDKTMAIQQAEVSSTQHNPAIAGKYPLAISPNSSASSGDESIKNTEEQSTTVAKIDVDKMDKELYIPLPPKIGMVTSSIPPEEKSSLECEITHLENAVAISQEAVPKSALCQNKSVVEDQFLTLNNKEPSGELKSNEIFKNKTLLQSPESHLETSTTSLKEALDQDDSEDDISLATILKQKQRAQNQLEEPSPSDSEKDIQKVGKNKKKNKKHKRTVKKDIVREMISDQLPNIEFDESNNMPENITKITCKVAAVSNQNFKQGVEPDRTDALEKSVELDKEPQHSKKMTKKSNQKTNVSDRENVVHKLQTKKLNQNNYNKVVDSESKETIKDTDENIKTDDICLDVTKNVLDEVKHVEILTEISYNKSKAKESKELSNDIVIKIDKQKDDICQYKATKSMQKMESTETEVITHNKEKDKKNLSIIKSGETFSEVRNEDTPCIKYSNMTQDLVTSSAINDDDLKHSEKEKIDNIIIDSSIELKKDKKYGRNKKAKNVEIGITSQNENSQDLDTKEMTPLRRSRRGKSLYMESHLVEKEDLDSPEIAVEQKTPLTKKQLIFSKLLLDEGNSKPIAHSTPEKQDLSKDVNDDKIDIAEVSDIKLDDEPFIEKNKGIKRRISAHGSKKSKKKKSLENIIKDISDTNDILRETCEKSVIADSKSVIDVSTDEYKQEPNESKKEDVIIDEKDDLATTETSNVKLVNIPENNNVSENSSEKRKISNQISLTLSQSSKPKKIKIVDNEKQNLLDNDAFSTSEKDNKKDGISHVPETRTACYNLPIPAKRGRSKSVGVKSSSADIYDPYDIDLEDMIEHKESFRSRNRTTIQKNTNSRKGKFCSTVNKEVGSLNQNNFILENAIEKNTVITIEKAIDSDDSSKSDVPLQKYVEDKEKKITGHEISTKKDKPVETIPEKVKKPTNYEETCYTTVSSSVEQNEAEQELRSEQFMESFGFFSERKPRKSNLLASKKISETIHITNESDDMYFGFKERSSKKSSQTDNKKSAENDISKSCQPSTSKKAAKRGRKKKSCTKILPCYCGVCKKEFRRPDNFLRHQMTLLHVSKLSEVELKVKTAPIREEPNYLIAYKQYLDRFKKLTDRLAKKKKKNPKAAAKIVLPTLEQILADVNTTVREQQLSQRGLSNDEALFLDCCELLKESHRGELANKSDPHTKRMSGLDILEKALDEDSTDEYKSDDGDVDSITAQNILESEEVRNLENDLISGLKEAANATRKSNFDNNQAIDNMAKPNGTQTEPCSSPNADIHYQQIDDFDVPEKPRSNKSKRSDHKHIETIPIKEKMYPDIIEDIDMFEDKFDKIKRKCRSQAAAAKQHQPIVETIMSTHAGRRKSEKKKGKKNSKKTRHQGTQVPTKGALKGFDGIKVSIPTSDINIAGIVPATENSKKKKKSNPKKKRDKRDSESSGRYDSDHRNKDTTSSSNNKKVDVYEFMDNEDAELFEFRPSTLMERFKSISNKDTPNTSKSKIIIEENSSDSGSDGDDFVYMSDDYVCSDDETENSLLSCETGNVKLGSEIKKSTTPQKRKDVVEKNAVMGKIFKHNAVRTEKKSIVAKEPVKPKANLDQLFDSLLEEEPSSSMLQNEVLSPKDIPPVKRRYSIHEPSTSKVRDEDFYDDSYASPKKFRSPSPVKNLAETLTAFSKRRTSSTSSTSPSKHEISFTKRYDSLDFDDEPSTSKKYDNTSVLDYGLSTSKKYDTLLPKVCKASSPKNDLVLCKETDESKHYNTKPHKHKDSSSLKREDEVIQQYDDPKSPSKKLNVDISTNYDYNAELDQSAFDDTGVARQRARRKCTVGKQNVLAETWSSESEPDGGPPRPNSAESDITGGRKKKGRKKEGQQSGGRRGNNRQVVRKQDTESRVSSNSRNTSIGSASSAGMSGSNGSTTASAGIASTSGGNLGEGTSTGTGGPGVSCPTPSTSAAATAAAAAEAEAAAAMPAPSTSQAPSAAQAQAGQKGRPRSLVYYWSSEGDDEQEHQQQHGWIVGDSHKKLVTMLAHAKGRKRNNEDKRHLIE